MLDTQYSLSLMAALKYCPNLCHMPCSKPCFHSAMALLFSMCQRTVNILIKVTRLFLHIIYVFFGFTVYVFCVLMYALSLLPSLLPTLSPSLVLILYFFFWLFLIILSRQRFSTCVVLTSLSSNNPFIGITYQMPYVLNIYITTYNSKTISYEVATK